MKEEHEREARFVEMGVHTLKTHGARRNIGGINSGSGGVLWLCIEIPELASICSREKRRERGERKKRERGEKKKRERGGRKKRRERGEKMKMERGKPHRLSLQ